VPDRRKPAKPSAPDFEAEFAEWWAVYPNSASRDASFVAYVKARQGKPVRGQPKRDPVSAEVLLDGATRYAAEMRRLRKTKDVIAHGSTWLNGGRWKDYDDQRDQKPRVVNGPSYGEAWG